VHHYAIRGADVKFIDECGNETQTLSKVSTVELRFRGCKSDQFGMGTSRVMAKSGHRWCCPVLAAWYLVRHHEALEISAEDLLCKVDAAHNLQVCAVVRAIKHAAHLAGLNSQEFASHSLRSGGATALFNAGFDSLAVKLFRRWKSDAVERYTRISSQLSSRMASKMLAKPSLHQLKGASPTPRYPGSGGDTMQLRPLVPLSARPESRVTSTEKRLGASDQNPKQKAKALKVEGQQGASVYEPPDSAVNEVFATREGRLQRHWERLQQRAPRAPFVPRPGTRCHYCNQEGHFVRDCDVKKADLEASHAQNEQPAQGNEPRA
jgi:hypothetical protein